MQDSSWIVFSGIKKLSLANSYKYKVLIDEFISSDLDKTGYRYWKISI